jgi:imidazolonepropionase-like amidohydrolase
MRDRIATFALLVLTACAAPPVSGTATALVGGRIIDGRGGPPIEGGVIVLHGDSIVAVGSRERVPVPEGATIIDVTGRSVLPGLIEANGHVTFSGQIDHAAYFAAQVDHYYEIGARHLEIALQQGVTSVRDTHGAVDALFRLKRDVSSGRIAGARLFAAGAILHYESLLDIPTTRSLDTTAVRRARHELDRFVPDAATGVRLVRALHDGGADFIKISLSGSAPGGPAPVALDDSVLAAIVSEAHRLGLRTTAHAMSRETIRRAVALGFDALEHPAFTIEQGRAVELPDALVAEIVRKGVYCVPLLVAMEVYNRYAAQPDQLDDAAAAGIRPELLAEARAWAAQEHATPGALAALDTRYQVVRSNQHKLIRAGARIAMGTDKGTRLNYHELANHMRELEIYTELGMTPLEAISTATLRGAELLGQQSRLGTLEVGKRADLLVVDGDPSLHIRDLARVRLVYKDGVAVPR